MLAKRKKRSESEIPTSAMADIAFLLLIFFLVTTTIDTDKGLTLVLPAKGEQKEIPKRNISNILINEAGGVMLDEELVEVDRIRFIAEKKILRNENIIFSLQTARGTKYQVYIDVLDQLKAANATRISIAEPVF